MALAGGSLGIALAGGPPVVEDELELPSTRWLPEAVGLPTANDEIAPIASAAQCISVQYFERVPFPSQE